MVVSGTRADFGLLRLTINEILAHTELELKLVVTGTHLSQLYGNTISEIQAAGVPVAHELPILDETSPADSVATITARAIDGFGKIFEKDRPDILILLGDRYESFAAATAALFYHIPIGHIHGGELTFGAIDDALRHSMTKMSWWHFTSAEEYKNRVIHLGENPNRVFNVGATAVDSIEDSHLSKEELETFLGLNLIPPVVLATFHPETNSPGESIKQLHVLWEGIKQSNPGTLIFTKANADAEGNLINKELEKLMSEGNIKNAKLVSSLGHRRYLGLLRLSDVAVGNSSSLVIEAPMVATASINVGSRQEGRIRAASVIDTQFDSVAILNALKKSYSEDFRQNALKQCHPFGSPGVAKRIVDVLTKVELPKILVKGFYE